MISSTTAQVDVDLVRLVHGDENPDGPGAKIEQTGVPGHRVSARVQDTHLGSCVVVDELDGVDLAGTTLTVLFQPTRPRSGQEQAVAMLTLGGRPAVGVVLDGRGRLCAGRPDVRASASLDVPWRRDTWYRAELTMHEDRVELTCTVVSARAGTGRAPSPMSATGTTTGLGSFDGFVAAAQSCERQGRRWVPTACFDGKVENPRLTHRSAPGAPTQILLDWRFELSPEGSTAVDVSGAGRDGVVVNAPARGVTGHRWSRTVVDHTQAPEEYGAIHFHGDDLDDAGWDVSTTIALQPDLPSGVYGVRLRTEDAVDVIPFAVTPGPSARRSRIAVLLPTFTYVAYANERMLDRLDFEGEQMTDHPVEPGDLDRLLAEHPEWGLSLYDVHADGSTCVHSTHLRPIPNLRPDYRAWLQNAPRHLGADLYLVDWLSQAGHAFDVLTDHDLHAAGSTVLEDYAVVLTGSHPEYVSAQILDALESYLDAGGHLMYLGGNGFYWVTSQDQQRPHLIEVRRGPVGTRPSEGAAGEGVHSTTGEVGGLWRQRGRAPNRLTGIGMTAQGWDEHAPGYRRMPDSFCDRAAFLFDGIGADEVIGDFGLIMNGSSGDELDRFDLDRGSPEETLVLARSTGHSDYYQLAGEDLLATRAGVGGAECDDVRSDLTLLPHPGGGWVLSVGSICFSGSISHHGYDNNVARLLGNALSGALGD
ncbi:N,N-dimethylformamidase beta subunit family domain-containing protein [Solicola sp. PLA-1-18]|uniref:N,N-dimethylformamidase beta subunit family domain-containing protein n=1 Tax=Solicola sp. PLA-1-18 TaxID=3380532 RepID=UPI003B9E53EA